MNQPANTTLLEELQSAIAGEVWSDALSRALYATDASIYEIVADDVQRLPILRYAWTSDLSL